MNRKPLVSVIIPTYNRESTLPKTIDSVIKQIFKDWELIIVDDRSSDNTKDLIKNISSQDSRIKYFNNKGKKGPSGARNSGIKYATGEYISFLDSDDEWVPEHLINCITAINEENVSVCFALWWEKDHSGDMYKIMETAGEKSRFNEALQNMGLSINNSRIVFPSPQFFEFNAKKTLHCCHINTLVLKREVINRIGLFNEDLLASEDLDYLYRITHEYPFCLIMDYHFIYNCSFDNIHNFIDRRKIDVEDVLKNKTFIDKLTFCGIYKCKAFKLRKRLINGSKKINGKEKYIEKCNDKISIKYFTLGYLNQRSKPIHSLIYLLKSMLYKNNSLKIKLAINTLFPFIFNNIKVNAGNLWFG